MLGNLEYKNGVSNLQNKHMLWQVMNNECNKN